MFSYFYYKDSIKISVLTTFWFDGPQWQHRKESNIVVAAAVILQSRNFIDKTITAFLFLLCITSTHISSFECIILDTRNITGSNTKLKTNNWRIFLSVNIFLMDKSQDYNCFRKIIKGLSDNCRHNFKFVKTNSVKD